jgi:MFS family permease
MGAAHRPANAGMTAQPRQGITPQIWPTLMPVLLLDLACFMSRLAIMIYPTVTLSLERQWAISYAEMLSLGAPLFVAFFAAGGPAAWLNQRAGPRLTLVLFWFGSAAASLFIGIASTRETLPIGLAALGAAAAFGAPAELDPARERLRRTRLTSRAVTGGLGAALGIAMTAVVAARWGWRTPFLAAGIANLSFGVISACVRLRSGRDLEGKTSGAVQDEGDVQRRVMIVLGANTFVGGLSLVAALIILPKLLHERLAAAGWDIGVAGTLAALAVGIAAIAQLLAPRALRRLGARRCMLLAELAKAPLLLWLAFVTGPLCVLIAALALVPAFAALPIRESLLRRHVAPHWRGRALAIEWIAAMAVGLTVVPMIATLHDSNNASGALLVVLAWLSLIPFLTGFVMPSDPRPGPLLRPARR